MIIEQVGESTFFLKDEDSGKYILTEQIEFSKDCNFVICPVDDVIKIIRKGR